MLRNICWCSVSSACEAVNFVSDTTRQYDLTYDQKSGLLEVAVAGLDLSVDMTKDDDALWQELLDTFESEKLDQARIEEMLSKKGETFKRHARVLIAKVAEFHGSLSSKQRQAIGEALSQNGKK
ncbi:MAG: hypothetical protein ACE5NW_17520 [Acidiferrobacterales bacterium]